MSGLLLNSSKAISFIPTQIPGLSIWLDGDDVTTITLVGSKVSAWTDKSGNGNDATQSVDLNRLTYVTDIQNGRNILRGSGNQWLFNATSPTLTTTVTIYVVYKQTNEATNNTVFGADDAAFNRLRLFSATDFDANFKHINFTNKQTGVPTRTNNTVPVNNFVYTGAIVNGTSLELRVNKNSVSDTIANDAIGSGYVVCANRNGGASRAPFIGDFAELVVYDRVITTVERDNLENYFSQKYAI